MRKGVNRVILLGNVGQDPDSRVMPSGGSVVSLSLATSESWKDKNTGKQNEVTEWHKLIFFNKLADIVSQYVKKGSKIYVEGALKTRSWEQDGIKRYATEIVCTEMQMIDGKRDEEQKPSDSMGAAKELYSQAPASSVFHNFDDDIPF